MKKYILLALAVAVALVAIPAGMSGNFSPEGGAQESGDSVQDGQEQQNDGETITVFMADTGQTKELAMREYVISALAAEMPAVYEEAALRAQALASVTLARYMLLHNQNNEELQGAVISTDSKKYQAYMGKEEMKERWGDNFEEYYKKICDAVDEVLPYGITYNGEIITAVFHAVSTGVTEDAENVWGRAVPYLVSVESEGDVLSPGYRSTVSYSPEELLEALEISSENESFDEWIGEGEYSQAGTLMNIDICGVGFTGAKIREALDLRSAAIKISYDGEGFVFDVTGYGHGVGMSQYGADYYARQGYTWQEIISHYYPGAEITEIKPEIKKY